MTDNKGYNNNWARFLMQKKIEYCNNYIRGDVLNYGCGEPDLFYDYINRNKITYYRSYDPNVKGKEILEGNYNCIFCSLVLEHVDNVQNTLNEIMNHLMTNGYLIISVPNSYSFQRKMKNQQVSLTIWDKEQKHIRLFNYDNIDIHFSKYKITKTISLGFKPCNSDEMNTLVDYWESYCEYAKKNNIYDCAEIIIIIQK